MASKPIILCAIAFFSFSSWALPAQSQTGGGGSGLPCVQKLMPCEPYLKKPGPPPTCCVPLKELMDGDTSCLCTVFYNKELLKTFNVTQGEALQLPPNCGLRAPDLTKCKNTTDTPALAPPTPATPSATPSKGTSTSDASHGKSIMSAVFVLLASGMFFITLFF